MAHTGIMISLDVPAALAEKLQADVPNPTPAGEFHITLVFLGDIGEGSDEKELDRITAAFAKDKDPISGKVGGIGRLYTSPEEDDAIVAFFDCPDLPKFRQDLVDFLDSCGVGISIKHGFTPHITLGYISKDAEMPTIELEQIDLLFSSLFLHFGEHIHEYPLQSSQRHIKRSVFWDGLKGLYLDEGSYLSKQQITNLLRASTDLSAKAINKILSDISLGDLSKLSGINELKQELKKEFIRQYLVGIGGLDNMTPRDWGSLGAMLRKQYTFLPDLVETAKAGNASQAQMDAYGAMNAGAASKAYNVAKSKTAKTIGFDEVAWNLRDGFKHCPTCEIRAGLGYQPAGPRGGFMHDGLECWPGDGTSECLTNDQCGLSYRNSETGETYE